MAPRLGTSVYVGYCCVASCIITYYKTRVYLQSSKLGCYCAQHPTEVLGPVPRPLRSSHTICPPPWVEIPRSFQNHHRRQPDVHPNIYIPQVHPVGDGEEMEVIAVLKSSNTLRFSWAIYRFLRCLGSPQRSQHTRTTSCCYRGLHHSKYLDEDAVTGSWICYTTRLPPLRGPRRFYLSSPLQVSSIETPLQ